MQDGMVSWKLGISMLEMVLIRFQIMMWERFLNSLLDLQEEQLLNLKIGRVKICGKTIGDLLTKHWVKMLKLQMITLMELLNMVMECGHVSFGMVKENWLISQLGWHCLD